MKTLTGLNFETATDGQDNRLFEVLQVVHDEPTPGFIRKVSLGRTGLTVQHGPAVVMVPLAELLAMAEKADGILVPPGRLGEAALPDEKEPPKQ